MKKFFLAGLGILGLCTIILATWLILTLSHLPDISILKNYRPAAAAEVLDKDGKILTQYFERKLRIWVPIASLPGIVIRAVIIAEDDTFFDHNGVNYKATWDALVHDVQKRRFARGGSTITQQMIKNVLLSREKTITRKLREYILARRTEELLTKRQILEIYLNEVEWGDNVYGIEAASRFYFDKHASELSLSEAALLAGMLPNPRYFNPYKRPGKAKDRQERVLANMLQAKLVSRQDYEAAVDAAFELRSEGSGRFYFPISEAADDRPRYHYALEQILLNVFGDQTVYRSGCVIRSTLDKDIQDTMNRLEEVAVDKPARIPATVTVVQQNRVIRAILCLPGKEANIHDALPSPFFETSGYEVTTVPLDSISREQIVLSVEGEKHAAIKTRTKRQK